MLIFLLIFIALLAFVLFRIAAGAGRNSVHGGDSPPITRAGIAGPAVGNRGDGSGIGSMSRDDVDHTAWRGQGNTLLGAFAMDMGDVILNPTTGLPMPDGPDGFDIGGSPWCGPRIGHVSAPSHDFGGHDVGGGCGGSSWGGNGFG